MSGGFGVDATALDEHSRQVDRCAARIREAAAAGQPLDRGAYGWVGQLFAMQVEDAARQGSALVAELARRAGEVADGIRATRDTYLRVEHDNAAGFGGVR